MQQSPDDRFQTCDELLYALNHYEQESNAFRARQKKKLVTALATAGTGVLLLLVGLGAFIAGKADVRANYERLVNASSYGYAQCQEAMEYDSTRLEALNRLVDSYETQGVFDLEQSKELTQAYNEYTGAKNTPEYLETCFQIGTLYMNFYTENGNQSLLACTRKAYDYFEQIESAGHGKKLSRFEHSSAAHNYYVISKFYKESGGLKLETRRSAGSGAAAGRVFRLHGLSRHRHALRAGGRLPAAVHASGGRGQRAAQRVLCQRRGPVGAGLAAHAHPDAGGRHIALAAAGYACPRWIPWRHIWKMWP